MELLNALKGWRKYILIVVFTAAYSAGLIDEATYRTVVGALGLGVGIAAAGRHVAESKES